MTKKDYELIASVLFHQASHYKELVDNAHGDSHRTFSAQLNAVSLVAAKLANELEEENPRFNRGTFLTACGMVPLIPR